MTTFTITITTRWTYDELHERLTKFMRQHNDTSYRGFGFKPPIDDLLISEAKQRVSEHQPGQPEALDAILESRPRCKTDTHTSENDKL